MATGTKGGHAHLHQLHSLHVVVVADDLFHLDACQLVLGLLQQLRNFLARQYTSILCVIIGRRMMNGRWWRAELVGRIGRIVSCCALLLLAVELG